MTDAVGAGEVDRCVAVGAGGVDPRAGLEELLDAARLDLCVW